MQILLEKHSHIGINGIIKIFSEEPCIVYSVKKIFWEEEHDFLLFSYLAPPTPLSLQLA
jgi:hypothetical protein